MSILDVIFKKVRIHADHPHYSGATGTVNAPAIGGRWCVALLDGEKRYALGLRITCTAVMHDNEFEVIG